MANTRFARHLPAFFIYNTYAGLYNIVYVQDHSPSHPYTSLLHRRRTFAAIWVNAKFILSFLYDELDFYLALSYRKKTMKLWPAQN